MITKLLRDTRGGTIVEFTIVLPLFSLLTFGLFQAGYLFTTILGLQHGVEVATRCASVNYSANQLGLSTSCFVIDGAPVAPSTVCGGSPSCNVAIATPYIQAYAAQKTFGLAPSFSDFKVTQTLPPGGACPTNLGYVVKASMNYYLIDFFTVNLTTSSTFPIACTT